MCLINSISILIIYLKIHKETALSECLFLFLLLLHDFNTVICYTCFIKLIPYVKIYHVL